MIAKPPEERIGGVEAFDQIVLYGSRGHSQMIWQVLQGIWQGRAQLRAVIDDLENGFDHPALGVPVISGGERLLRFADVPVLLSMGDGALRARIAARLAAEGAVLASALHRRPESIAPDAQIGAGCILNPATLISPNVTLGAGVQVLAAAIGHDVTIGAYSTLAYGAVVNGHVEMGRQVSIGAGAIINNGRPGRPLRIGDGAVIGAGAVVMRDVAAGARMVGNPAMTTRDWARMQALVRRAR
ncbi:acetyltransferase [Pseudotabrizicola algicola]|uniref:Acetyltransferase n=1 Tax=Pseudotabrizicola algicola TaxID=2709381 RepID=A0A6B3RFE1_9RHOB|nr:acetyltransferase [Pseudotabrizicola algicola]NEX44814.1 acetyltransferase [Pseudotabrizicola algicola]